MQDRSGVTALYDVEQLVVADQLGRPQPVPVGPDPSERGLVQPQRGGRTDPVGIVDECEALVEHGTVHAVPITPELSGDLRNGAPVASDLLARPPDGPIGHPAVADRDPLIDLGPRPDRAANRRRIVCLTRAGVPHDTHAGRGTLEAMWTCSGTVQPITPTTSTSTRPTRERHINVGSTSTGTPRVGGFSTSTLAGSLCTSEHPQPVLTPPRAPSTSEEPASASSVGMPPKVMQR